ncbi:hypothetical protein [Pseudoduganella lutea]|uniref:Uncharacterized protein n=1 Tax=Pseudoduganella lutea TaxID=321985 RepID=A0A4P6KXH4_9BURK|nr:hypothetical protein [Pseudoduganella lutea]QBE63435.1 hypothetical protein EWM63_11045 [Pseudoduganella lutea]
MRHRRIALASSLLTTVLAGWLGIAGAAHAQAAELAQMRKGYADMCKQAVAIPAEYGGESDLKGHAKLAPYCDCVAIPWTDRAVKAMNGAAPPSAEQVAMDELATRTSCRKKVGAPPPPAIKPVA